MACILIPLDRSVKQFWRIQSLRPDDDDDRKVWHNAMAAGSNKSQTYDTNV